MISNSLALDAAFESLNAIKLLFPPTPAQFGALRCHEAMGRSTNRVEWDDPTDDSVATLQELWQAKPAFFWAELAEVTSSWASSGDPSSGAKIGYWLTWIRQHGLTGAQVEHLTRFLSKPSFPPKRCASKSVRRYPTGGISEKQAILLPAVLRLLSGYENFHSSFLIARRLAHTGGTSDKLRVLPGFSVQPASELSKWSGASPTVRYFTADATFCPRDEVLYFLRGETGTVRQLGLIVASIISKQFALQADLTLLDVLYGDGAFFHTVREAEAFQRLARGVAMSLKLPLEFSIRPTTSVAWRSVGNATEVAEIVELLGSPCSTGIPLRSELATASVFAARLISGPAMTASDISKKVEEAWKSGELLQNLCELWSEHQVDRSFLAEIRSRGSDALLGGLHSAEILAANSGVVRAKNVVQLADVVNNQLNSYHASRGGLPESVGVGGLVLEAAFGQRVEAGQTLARVYSSDAIDGQVHESISANLVVEENPE